MSDAYTIDVLEATFAEAVLARSHEVPVVVDFWASWCGPCRALGPALEALATEGQGSWILAKVDIDANPGLAQKYAIQSIPSVKAFIDGQEVDGFVGTLPTGRLRAFLAGLRPSEADQAVDQARLALDGGDRPAAEQHLAEALSQEPGHGGALVLQAELAARAGDREAFAVLRRALEHQPTHAVALARLGFALEAARIPVADWQTRLDADPRDLEAIWGLAMAQAAEGALEPALAGLLSIVERDRKFRDDGARKAMLDIFAVAGIRSKLSDHWRMMLTMTLY